MQGGPCNFSPQHSCPNTELIHPEWVGPAKLLVQATITDPSKYKERSKIWCVFVGWGLRWGCAMQVSTKSTVLLPRPALSSAQPLSLVALLDSDAHPKGPAQCEHPVRGLLCCLVPKRKDQDLGLPQPWEPACHLQGERVTVRQCSKGFSWVFLLGVSIFKVLSSLSSRGIVVQVHSCAD